MRVKINCFSKLIVMLLVTCMVVTAYIPLTATADDSATDLDTLMETFSSDTLYCGAAVRDITPTSDMYPLERKAAGDLVGVIDPLHVRVIAINDGDSTSLILSFETGRGPYAPQYVPALAEHTNVDEGNIFFTATHSHACPEITAAIDLDADTNLAKWGNLVMDQMLEAADEAIANLEPSEVGIGYADSYTNVNRSAYYTKADGTPYREIGYNGSGYSDKLLTAIQFNSLATGKPIAFIISHATHGVVMHANEYFDDAYEGINFDASEKYADGVLGVSSDLPGYISTYLEENFEGSVALYLCGAAGDQNPIVMNEVYTANQATGEQEITHIAGGSVEILEYLAKIQYQDVLTALSTIEEFSINVSISNAFDGTELPTSSGGTYAMHLQLLRIGDIALVGNAGELFNSIGVYMRENSLLKDTLVVNCCWNNSEQNVAYFADDDAIINGGAMATQTKYAAGYVNEYMTTLMNDLIEQTNWVNNGDGTATHNTTGETVIVGLDGVAGTDDDNKIVNPAGTVLIENATLSYDSDGTVYVALGNGFNLYGGEDGLIGTYDDVVKGFGSYAQSDSTGATKDPLNWLLLDIQDGNAILISNYIIDGLKFNIDATSGNDWAYSNLRSWLNSNGGENVSGDTVGFYNTAFTDAEKDKIVLTSVDMDSDSSFIAYNRTKSSDWWEYYTTTGTSTEDYVWALSGEETFEYFGQSKIATEEELGHDPVNYTDGYFKVTDYAFANGVKRNEGGNGPSFIDCGDSWTRSPGRVVDDSGNYYGLFWGSVGSLNSGRPVNTDYGALPVITVSLSGSEDNSIDITFLELAIEYAEQLKVDGVLDNVFDAVKEEFEAALQNAYDVINSTTSNQDDVDAAFIRLMSAISKTDWVKGDKNQLERLVTLAKATVELNGGLSAYVDSTAYEEALVAAEAVLADETAFQDEIDEAYESLWNAFKELRLKADKSALQVLIAQAQSLDLTIYTADSVAVLNAALESAIEVNEDESLSEDDQAVVDGATDVLVAAINGLVLSDSDDNSINPDDNSTDSDANSTDSDANSTDKDDNSTDPGSSDSDSNSTDSDNSATLSNSSTGSSNNTSNSSSSSVSAPSTGDTMHITLFILLICGGIILAFALRKNKSIK